MKLLTELAHQQPQQKQWATAAAAAAATSTDTTDSTEWERKVERKRWRVWETERAVSMSAFLASVTALKPKLDSICASPFLFPFFSSLSKGFSRYLLPFTNVASHIPRFGRLSGRAEGAAALKPSCIFKCYVAFGGTWPRSFLLPDTAEQRNVSMRLPTHTHTHTNVQMA